ncbi:MAG TPA: hypothetical protein VMB78_03710 [Dissulfurispiraceae bacterium]|nr:hypothetical protein [Dissulfurispiraceae bacterium]
MSKQGNVIVEPISQLEADKLMKSVEKSDPKAFKGFLISFTTEKKKIAASEIKKRKNNRLVWALPPEERHYYCVKYGKKPYLLVGISDHDTISSLAKITSSLSGKGGECLKALIENELVNKCYAGVIYIEFNEDCDPAVRNLLLKLREALPDGIERIYVFRDAASIICKVKPKPL